MTHDQLRRLVPMLADGALGPFRRWQVARHVARCPSCAAERDAIQATRAVVRTRLTYHRAPPSLAARIGAALPREAPPPAPARLWFRLPAVWSGAAGALAGVALTLVVTVSRAPDEETRAVVDGHVRSMMADHLTDVLSTDQHTVKPWLSARLDVSPAIRDLTDDGFPLIGGRLDYIDGHRGAAVVYRHAKHVINLFAWAAPGHANTPPRRAERQGFNVITWHRDGIAYYAVSDLEADQLMAFAQLVAAQG
jgi:anti-sigma factor RsiW